MEELLGSEFSEFLKFYNSDSAFRGLRVNTLKCSADKLLKLLPFELKKTPFCEQGYYLPENVESIGNNPLHHAGAFYVQEPSATSAVTMLDVNRGDRVLDLCAAPGGKSTQIAAKLNGEGLLVCNEIVRNRAIILLSNIERMGVRNAVVTNSHPDALCGRLTGFFDKVLVDAPCSGEGMFRKNSAKQEWSAEHVRSCAARQLQILNSAKNTLRGGGELVYSTCTFSKEENEGVIERFLTDNPDFELIDSGVSFGRPALSYARRIFPMDGGEGHFAAKLRRNTENTSVPINRQKSAEKIDNILGFYDENFKNRPFGENIELKGDKILVIPDNLPDLRGINILRAGILLGEMKKNRIEPHHCAYMAAKTEDCRRFIDFDVNSDEIKRFLHGEELSVKAEKGFCAVCVNGITTGFGKSSGSSVKNKYPKGLRTL